MSAVLVIVAGLLLRSAHGVASIPRGFVPEGVLVAQLHTAGYSNAEGHVLYRRLLAELQAKPAPPPGSIRTNFQAQPRRPNPAIGRCSPRPRTLPS